MDAFNALLFEGHKHNVNSDTWVTISHPVAKYLGHRAYLLAIDEGPGVLEVDTVACDYTPPWAEPRTNRNARGLPLMQWRLGQVDDEPLLASSNGLLEAAAALPPPVTVVRYQDASVVEQPVWNRGDPSQPGEAAPRHVPALLGGDDANRPGPGESGRLQLAQAVTHPDNPLLWRTAANRVWHHLMGAGFTDQLDDLGAMGTPPTHPVLLDTLARQLADGGSIKELVRTIVLSNAYARSSHRTERSDELDPLNRSFHRANVRRLSGEQLRDAMLVASESLDDTVGGPPVPLHLSESMTGRGRPGKSGPRDGAGRRSLYIGVRRNFADPMFAAFDRPTPNRPCGARTVSNVPAQSLTLMNDPFVHDQAGRIARYALQHDAPVHLLAMRLWGRPFTDEEVSLYTPATIDESSLTTLAHAMICAKAFTFLP